MDKSSRSNPMLVGENARQSDVTQSWEQDNQAWWDWYVTLAENESQSTDDLVDAAPIQAIDLPSDADIADELNTLYQLTPDKCEAFRRDGFIKLPNVLSLGAMVRLRKELIAILCENFDTTLDGGTKDRFLSLEMVWLEQSADARIRAESAYRQDRRRPAGRAAQCASTTTTCCRRSPAAGGPPGTMTTTTFPLATHDVVTAWIPAQPIPVAMGPLAFAKPIDVYKLVESIAFNKFDTSYDRHVTEVFRAHRVAVEDGPFDIGEVSFHHNLSFHTAAANRTRQSRVVLANTYYADGARVLDRPTMVSGDWQKFIPGVEPGEVAASELNPVCWPAEGPSVTDTFRAQLRALERGRPARDGGLLRPRVGGLSPPGASPGLEELGWKHGKHGSASALCGCWTWLVARASSRSPCRAMPMWLLRRSSPSTTRCSTRRPSPSPRRGRRSQHPSKPEPNTRRRSKACTCPRGAFDIVWATHALYAIPEAELMGGLSRFLTALGGSGFIAHASAAAHYLRFYKFYLQGFKNGEGVPYSSAEQIMATLDRLGVRYDAREIVYENGAADDAVEQIEGYLQRCIFDDTIDLAQMIKNPVTGPFLRSCHQNGRWRFSQRVMMIFICT